MQLASTNKNNSTAMAANINERFGIPLVRFSASLLLAIICVTHISLTAAQSGFATGQDDLA